MELVLPKMSGSVNECGSRGGMLYPVRSEVMEMTQYGIDLIIIELGGKFGNTRSRQNYQLCAENQEQAIRLAVSNFKGCWPEYEVKVSVEYSLPVEVSQVREKRLAA